MVPQKGNPMESYQNVCIECGQDFSARDVNEPLCGLCRKNG